MHLGVAELGHAEKLVDVGRHNLFLVLAAVFDHAARHLAADVAELALKIAHASLARVVANDFENRIVLEDNVLLTQAGLLALLFDQILLGDFELFLLGVALQLQNLHAVLQGRRDGMQHVGRGHEQHLRKIVIDVEIVILEAGVLLRVKHLKQGRGRVATEVRGDLVNLVEQEDRVLGAGALHVLNDLPRQCADVGAAMAANLGLVPHAAERQAHELAAGGLGNRHAQRGFAHARRSGEAQNRALGILDELTDGQKFEDALLDLFKAVVILVENLFGELDRARLLRLFLPRHGQQPVNVVAADGRLGRHGRHGLELLQLLNGLVENLLGHAGGFNLLLQLVELALFAAAQFLLNGLDLLVEVILFLRALHLALDARLHVAVEVELFNFDVEHVGDARQPRRRVEDGQQFLLLFDAQLQIGGDGVGELRGLIHAHGGDDRLVVERLL